METKTKIIIGISVLALIGAGVGVYFYVKKKNEEESVGDYTDENSKPKNPPISRGTLALQNFNNNKITGYKTANIATMRKLQV